MFPPAPEPGPSLAPGFVVWRPKGEGNQLGQLSRESLALLSTTFSPGCSEGGKTGNNSSSSQMSQVELGSIEQCGTGPFTQLHLGGFVGRGQGLGKSLKPCLRLGDHQSLCSAAPFAFL